MTPLLLTTSPAVPTPPMGSAVQLYPVPRCFVSPVFALPPAWSEHRQVSPRFHDSFLAHPPRGLSFPWAVGLQEKLECTDRGSLLPSPSSRLSPNLISATQPALPIRWEGQSPPTPIPALLSPVSLCFAPEGSHPYFLYSAPFSLLSPGDKLP